MANRGRHRERIYVHAESVFRRIVIPDEYSDGTGDAVLPHRGAEFTNIPLDHPASRRWRGHIGTFIKEATGRQRVNEAWHLADWPAGYSMWARPRTMDQPGRRHIDYYIYGYDGRKNFKSPMEFAFHAAWLYDRPFHNNRPCVCTLCTGELQGTINRKYLEIETPEPSVERGDRRVMDRHGDPSTDAQAVDGPCKATRYLHMQNFLWDPELFSWSRGRDGDLRSRQPYRTGELVWASIPPIFPATAGGHAIRFWPVIVQDLLNSHHQKEAAPKGTTVTHPRAYRVRPLGGRLAPVISWEQILSWQAYELPPGLLALLENPKLTEPVSPNLKELSKFVPLQPWIQTVNRDGDEVEERPPGPSYADALGALSLAYHAAKIIDSRFAVNSPYRVGGGDELYQGLWLGPERIWVDDVVRVDAQREDQFHSPTGEPVPLANPMGNSQARGLLGHITELRRVVEGDHQVMVVARLFDLPKNARFIPEQAVGPSIPIPVPVTDPPTDPRYPVPELPADQKIRFRRITPDGQTVVLPLRSIAGRYDGLSAMSRKHLAILRLPTGTSREETMRQNIRLDALSSGRAASNNRIDTREEWPAEISEDRETLVKEALDSARAIVYETHLRNVRGG